jgi:type I restriction enzyme S subunit
MRDAILTAAVTGRLVPQDTTDTPASKILAELGVEPRATTERLPAGWSQVELGSILTRIEAGKSFATKGRPASTGELGVIKVSAMTWGEFRAAENKALPPRTSIDPRWIIRQGDLLVSRANTAEYVGACVLVNADRSDLILSDKSLRLIPLPAVKSAWLLQALRCRATRNQIERLATGTKESMRNISQAKLRGVSIPLPPTAEQDRIVAEVERQLSFVAACERAVEAGLARSAALRRSVLKAAFEGGLVPQDPSDEPASVLLGRIRAERATTGELGGRARRRGVRAS